MQFGQQIGKFQGVSFKLADMAIELRAAELLVLEAAWKHDQKTGTDMDMAIAKVKATEMLAMVADEALQIHGGMGLMSDLPLERIWRDARIERIWTAPARCSGTSFPEDCCGLWAGDPAPHFGTKVVRRSAAARCAAPAFNMGGRHLTLDGNIGRPFDITLRRKAFTLKGMRRVLQTPPGALENNHTAPT